MFKTTLITAFALMIGIGSFAQNRYFTKTGKITFASKAPMENIEANNKTVITVVDAKTGALQFAAQMKGFEFEKQLMQEHFNENYVESEKFPKAEFKGRIVNNSDINYSKNGSYAAKVSGKLTIHGVTKDVDVVGTIKIADSKLAAASAFTVLLSDFNIKIPSLVKDKLSNVVTININCDMELLKR